MKSRGFEEINQSTVHAVCLYPLITRVSVSFPKAQFRLRSPSYTISIFFSQIVSFYFSLNSYLISFKMLLGEFSFYHL